MNKKLVRSLFFLAMLAAPVLADGEIALAQPEAQSESVAQESVPEQASVAPEVAPATAPETVAKPTEPASTEVSMSQSASIFVQDPAVFHQRQAEVGYDRFGVRETAVI